MRNTSRSAKTDVRSAADDACCSRSAGSHDYHRARHRAQQGGYLLGPQSAPRGEQHVLVGGRACGNLQHRHLVRWPQVIVQRLGAQVGALVVGPGEQVLHEFPSDPQLGVG